MEGTGKGKDKESSKKRKINEFLQKVYTKTHESAKMRKKIRQTFHSIINNDPEPRCSKPNYITYLRYLTFSFRRVESIKQCRNKQGRFTSVKVTKLVDPIRSMNLFSKSEPPKNQIEKMLDALKPVVIRHGRLNRFAADEHNEQKSRSTYITLRSKGEDQVDKLIKDSVVIQDIILNLMKNTFCFVKQQLPKKDQIGFFNAYRSELPYNAFLTHYPASDVDDNLKHLDNVNYAAVVIQLSTNTSAGLFVWRQKDGPKEEIHLKQGEGVIVFKGVFHQVQWKDKTESRTTLVLMF